MCDEQSRDSVVLRDYRFQKKESFTYSNREDSTMNSSLDNCQQESPSGINCQTTTTEKSQEMDSKLSHNGSSLISGNLPTNYNHTKRPKTAAIIEKERQMKYLKERFPNLETMTVHNILSRHNFNLDAAIAELSEKDVTDQVNLNYENWKTKQESLACTSSNGSSIRQITSGSELVRKRLNPSINDMNPHMRKKVKRLRTQEFSDSDCDSDTGNYKDNRVYNSDEDSDIEIGKAVTKDKRRVLEFFQTATLKELQLMSSCSRKKAETLMEFRPFADWTDLVEKLQTNRGLSPELLNAAQNVLATRSNVIILLKKCKNLAEQMEVAVAAGAGIKNQPKLLNPNCHLTSHQIIGLNWLSVMHTQGVNGILADEMGLGKTVQVIAFFAYLKETGASVAGLPHLVIVPSSTLDNWKAEFERWCPQLKVFMYYGSIDERRMYRIEYWSKKKIADYDVVLTTYTMVTNTAEERKMFKVSQMQYVVFDEAHMLKNMNTQRYENLIRIKATNRILLTGTPLQNNLLELMSLLIFVMPAMFAGRSDDLKNLFQKNSKAKQEANDDLPAFEKEQIQQAKDIMKPFVLRRLKKEVMQDLPPKTEELVRVPLTAIQKERYDQLVSHFQTIGKQEKFGSYSGMSMMTDLRKLSNHPLLLRYHFKRNDLEGMAKLLATDPNYKDTVVKYIVDDLLCMSDYDIYTLVKQFKCLKKFALPKHLIASSGKFVYLDKKLEELKEGGHRVVIFSQYVITLNVMEEYLHMRNYRFLRLDGSTPVTIRKEIIDEFTENENIFIFLLSTRAGGLGINLTSADTVIIHDIDFNPYNDKQAEDRCHRMGQIRPVNVIRLVSQGTIEEVMWQMNQDKLKLEKEITTDEFENPDPKSVVKLLSSALAIDAIKATALVSPKSKS